MYIRITRETATTLGRRSCRYYNIIVSVARHNYFNEATRVYYNSRIRISCKPRRRRSHLYVPLVSRFTLLVDI